VILNNAPITNLKHTHRHFTVGWDEHVEHLYFSLSRLDADVSILYHTRQCNIDAPVDTYTEKDYMGQILEQLGLWIESIILAIGYPGITLVMLAENLFPPIPSELVMPFAGFLVGRGEMNLVLAIAAGTLGSVLGAIILYYIGMLAGEPLVRPFFRHYGRFFLLSEQDLDKALNAFTTHGDIIVLGGRVIPIIRSLISLPAGMNRMPLGRFLLFTTIGSTIWTSLLTVGGVILGANWEFVIEIVDQYQKLVLIVLVIAAVVFVVQRLRGLRRMAFSRSE
jgi:membrane protein DedA with SNARE-associated domain